MQVESVHVPRNLSDLLLQTFKLEKIVPHNYVPAALDSPLLLNISLLSLFVFFHLKDLSTKARKC